ncbi:hypothetical protein [Anaerovibrio lipolyticus]|uniref:hypothetical protein n=1 Tax=Anaerovibrio lipolyticus TaxID=82374 RepID=UPI0013647438|nr:hypothetical protein [Anaerovibrio lipolyticus]
MGTVKWEPICVRCGKKCGGGISRSESAGPPAINPPLTSGKCPSSTDGKHKPCWKRFK